MRPIIISDHVWDRGYVMVAYCPPINFHAAWKTADWKPLGVQEMRVKTDASGYVLIRYPDGTTQEIVRHSGPVPTCLCEIGQCDGRVHRSYGWMR